MKDNELVNNMMIDLDEYLYPEIKEIEKDIGVHSYLWRQDVLNALAGKQDHIAFRHPGSTNGHIVVDKDMIIQDIVFYDDTCYRFYEGDYESALKDKYIGTKLSTEEVENEEEN